VTTMGGEITLLLVLVGIYLAEGLWFLPRGAWLLRGSWFGAWQAVPAEIFPQLKGLHIGFGGLLPTNKTILVQAAPFLMTPEGVAGANPGLPGPPAKPSLRDLWTPWEQGGSLGRVEKKLFAGDQVLATALDEGTAKAWFRDMGAVAAADSKERLALLAKLMEEQMDTRIAARRWRRFRRLNGTLLTLCWVQFILVFLAFPILFLSGALSIHWPLYAFYLLANQLILVFFYRFTRKRVHPDGTSGSKTVALSLFCSPPYLIRAAEMISVEIFEGLHPLCVAWVVMDRKGFNQMAELFLRALTFPPPMDDAIPASVLQTVTEQRKTLAKWLDTRGIFPETLLTPPPLEGALAYCPRCRGEYLRDEGGCSNCEGVPLISTGHEETTK